MPNESDKSGDGKTSGKEYIDNCPDTLQLVLEQCDKLCFKPVNSYVLLAYSPLHYVKMKEPTVKFFIPHKSPLLETSVSAPTLHICDPLWKK